MDLKDTGETKGHDHKTPFCRMIGRHCDDLVHFEVGAELFCAMPQDDWIAVDADGAEMRRMQSHVAGRLSLGNRMFVVFATTRRCQSDLADGSIARILSKRELQVACYVADGLANKEIARKLGISDHTVREHIRRSCAKLNTSRRSALVAEILRRGATRGA